MFKYWKVGNDGKCYYVYNESIEEIKEEFDIQDPDFKFIESDKWTAENYAEILGDELENANHHRWTELPDTILRALEKSNLSKEKINSVMKEIAEGIYEMI